MSIARDLIRIDEWTRCLRAAAKCDEEPSEELASVAFDAIDEEENNDF